ncbi:tRNA (adenine-N1)-methyltransferase [Candidatus Bathyarchaeota archaeon]|nr:tRNA (adenine-N1)-methyltransferase [Candidatus Bathyarchaeota archaeon]|tara:strand:- start:99 stop:908 length:810 start_codon:yes stop_codon:yes gene_type:complete
MRTLSNGQRIHMVDRKERHYAITLKTGQIFQHSGETIPHDELIGRPDGTLITLSRGTTMLAVNPTFGDYVVKMPRGAQILYPKDLSTITMWADIYPNAVVFESGCGSGALTMTLLRAVGPKGHVISHEIREDFLKTARNNIERYLGPVTNLSLVHNDVYAGINEAEVDRVVLDLPEPWRVVPHAAKILRSGGIFLSFVPTVPQVVTTVEALGHEAIFTMIQTIEVLVRTWNIEGRSVRPDHRMVAHTGFITIARRITPKEEKTLSENRP